MEAQIFEILSVIHKNRFEEIQVRAVVHEGRDYLDIRVFKLGEDGQGGPEAHATGRGVTVRLRFLPELIEALEKVRPYYERITERDEEQRIRERGEGRP